ncbi:MAG: carbohydrate ABC transporter permease [Acidimicrobiales bacterium]
MALLESKAGPDGAPAQGEMSPDADAGARARRGGEGALAALFLLPALAFLALFVYLPAVMSLALGFFHYRLLGVGTTFAGVSNFKAALAYPIFRQATLNTLALAGMLVPASVIGAVAIASLLKSKTRYFEAARTIVLLPYVTPVIATTIGWLWMFNPQYGILNAVLRALHLPVSGWLQSPRMALPSIALYILWHTLGFDVVIMLSALSAVPEAVIEAAAVDGVGRWRTFWRVTVPLVSPTLFFLVVVTTIATLQAFSSVYGLSGGSGGPSYATTTLLLLVYQTAFQYFHFSYGAAMAFILVLLILAFTLVQRQLSKRWVFYDD